MKNAISKYLKHLNKKYGRSKLFKRFILSYIIILIVPLCLTGLFSFKGLVQALSDEVKNSTVINLSQVMDTIDMRLKELDYITVQISQNKSIIPMIYNKEISSLSEYQFYKLLSELKNYRATNGFIENLFIYFRNTDVIVSAEGKYSMPVFFSQVYHYNSMFESDFQYMLNTVSQPSVRPMETVGTTTGVKQIISFIRPIPISDTVYNATLMMTLDASSINKISHNVLGNFDGEVFIFDEKNNMVSRAGNPNKALNSDQIQALVKSDSKTIYEKNMSGTKQIITKLKSPHSGWSYVAIIPSNQILEKVNWNRLWTLIIILLSIAIGMALSYYFSYSNYYPVRETLELLFSHIKPDKHENEVCENEFNTINEILTNVIDENNNLELRLKEQMPVMRSNALMRILKGELNDPDEESKMRIFIGLEDLKGPFAVMILSINDYDEFMEQNSAAARETYRFAVANVVEELCLNIGKGFAADFSDDKISIIIDFKEDNKELIKQLVSIGKEARAFFEEKFNFVLTIGIGRTYPSLMDISKSYIEAKTAIDYRMVKGKNAVILFEQISTRKSERYFYSIQSEKKISNYIKEGNFDGIQNVLDGIIESVDRTAIDIKAAKLIYYQIVNTAMNALAELRSEDYNEIIRQGEEMPDLLKCDTLEEVYRETKAFYKIICERIKTTEKSKGSEFGESIIEYIQNNYTDSNISLNYLSDKFSVTPAYLSRFFKNYTNSNFLDYLHKLRLKKVKTMLKDTSKSISEVASQCGYLDSHSLIRGFKKYEGITPGKFRETYQKIR